MVSVCLSLSPWLHAGEGAHMYKCFVWALCVQYIEIYMRRAIEIFHFRNSNGLCTHTSRYSISLFSPYSNPYIQRACVYVVIFSVAAVAIHFVCWFCMIFHYRFLLLFCMCFALPSNTIAAKFVCWIHARSSNKSVHNIWTMLSLSLFIRTQHTYWRVLLEPSYLSLFFDADESVSILCCKYYLLEHWKRRKIEIVCWNVDDGCWIWSYVLRASLG